LFVSNGFRIAVIGATGAVGKESLEILETRKFPLADLRLFGSRRSAGKTLKCMDREWKVEELTPASSFEGIDIAFISATDVISREYGPRLAAAGATVIDDSSVFRMDPQVPLVVPEVNPQAAHEAGRGIIAIPNCTTTPLVMALKPLHEAAPLRRVVVTTFQSVSGTGAAAMEELMEQTRALFLFKTPEAKVYPYQIAFNLLPQIGSFSPEGDCSEETKIINESRKILGLPQLRITATTVRVPVLRCHCEAVNIETEGPLHPDHARALLAAASGVVLEDEPAKRRYPMPLAATGKDAVFVGRVRADQSVPHGLNLWLVADNLRKGAALNAVQIAEILVKAH
jgi:aspartate-semialdehyde dehydrogenase